MSRRARKQARDSARADQRSAAGADRTGWKVGAIAACLFLSGAGSLVLEVVWTRELRLVFGSSTLAATTVLVAYMLGLGLGGWIAGRRAHRVRNGVLAYGVLEICVAVLALGVPVAFDAYPRLYAGWFQSLPFAGVAVVRFCLSLAVTLVPTLLMGATLPLLVSAVVREDTRIGERVGLLYGVNTVGAFVGVLGATFLLFPWLGLRGSNLAGAMLDATAGVIALVFLQRGSGVATAATGQASRGGFSLPLAAYASVGFTALSYEVCWMRGLAMILGSSIYAFAAMLAAFLVGIAAGSLAARRLVDRFTRPAAAFAVGIAALGVFGLLTTWSLPRLPLVFLWATDTVGTTPRTLPAIHFLVAVLAMLPPTLVLGALFPLLVRMLAGRAEASARSVGDVYFWNTLGSALGAFSAGFFLIPVLGLAGSLAVCAAINFVTAFAIALWVGGPVRTRILVASAIGIVLAALAPGSFRVDDLTRGVFYLSPVDRHRDIPTLPHAGLPGPERLYYRDGMSTTVSVHRDGAALFLRTNGKTDAGTAADMPTQVLSAHVPLLFGGPAKDVLVIGLASGVTLGSVTAFPDVESTECVELEQVMSEASHFFDDYNGRPLEDPRVRLIVDDGRAFMSYTKRHYDTIISEPPNPWMTGVSNLFTREFFEQARAHLSPGGRLMQWVHLYGMDDAGFRSILATVRSVFPNVYGFAPKHGGGDLLMLATLEPLTRDDLPHWSRLPLAVKEDLWRVGIFDTPDLWSLIRFGPEHLDKLVGSRTPLNTDDNMRIELRAPWTLYRNTIRSNWALLDRIVAGSADVVESTGTKLDAEDLGALAFASEIRGDHATAVVLMRRSIELGASASGMALISSLAADAGAGATPDTLPRLEAALDGAVRTSASAELVRARMLAGRERYDDALASTARALLHSPGDPEALTLRGILLRRTGQAAASRDLFAALDTRPYALLRPEVWLEYGRALLDVGDLAKSARQLRRYVEAENNDPSAWALLARVERERGESALAAEATANVAIAKKNRARILHRNARAARLAGNPDEAAALLRSALEWDPEYAPARAELAANQQ